MRKVTTADWRRIIAMVWRGYTVPIAFQAGGFTPEQQRKALNGRPDIKDYLVDVSMAAAMREEILECTPSANAEQTRTKPPTPTTAQ